MTSYRGPAPPRVAALYCQVSTDGQEENNLLDSQEVSCQESAEGRCYTVGSIFRDVHSG